MMITFVPFCPAINRLLLEDPRSNPPPTDTLAVDTPYHACASLSIVACGLCHMAERALQLSIEAAVVDGFADVVGGDVVGVGEVGDRARYAQHLVVGASGQA